MAAKITVHWLLCGMLCWLFASPVYADTILDVDMSNLLFQAAAGNDSCSGLPCEETFNITFQWDNTTGLLVPATINVSGTGALSSADLSGPWRWIEGTNGTINYLIIGESRPTGPDNINIGDPDLTFPTLVPGVYPGTDAFLGCYQTPTQCDSLFNYHMPMGGVVSPGAALSGQVTVGIAVTPLPAALPVFATGIGGLGLFGLRRKRKNGTAIAAAEQNT